MSDTQSRPQPQTDIRANPQLLPSPREDAEPPIVQPTAQATQPWSQPQIAYDEQFDDDVMEAILDPPDPANDEDDDMDLSLDMTIETSDLPLSLHDFRRKHPSVLPGVKLPLPDSDLLGGPAPPPSILEGMIRDLQRDHRLKSRREVEEFLSEEISGLESELRARMEKRREALGRNSGVDREIRQLEMERDVQRRVEEKWREGRRASMVVND